MLQGNSRQTIENNYFNININGSSHDNNHKPIILRPKQKLPIQDKNWNIFLVCGGRGFGKTTAGAYNLNEFVMNGDYKNIGIIGDTLYDVRNIMYENHLSKINPQIRYCHSKKTLIWPNGTIGRLFGGAHFNTIRGYEFDLIWVDEFAKIQKCEELWKQINFSLRVKGRDGSSKIIITTTPHGKSSSRKLLEKIARNPKTFLVSGSSYENKENLSEIFLENIQEYEGTLDGEMEIHGRITNSNQLWNMEDIQYVSNIKSNTINIQEDKNNLHVLEGDSHNNNNASVNLNLEEITKDNVNLNYQNKYENIYFKKNQNINEEILKNDQFGSNNKYSVSTSKNHENDFLVNGNYKKEGKFYESEFERNSKGNSDIPDLVCNNRNNNILQEYNVSQNFYKTGEKNDKANKGKQHLKQKFKSSKKIKIYGGILYKKIYEYLSKNNYMGIESDFIDVFYKENNIKYKDYNVNKEFIIELINNSFKIYGKKTFSKKKLKKFIVTELLKRINNYFNNIKTIQIEDKKMEKNIKNNDNIKNYSKEEALNSFCRKEDKKKYTNYKEEILNKINNLNFHDLFIDEYAIGVDPAFGGNSEIGIILTGINKDNKYIVLEDFSGYYEPYVWHYIVVTLARKFNGTIILEVNHGGEVLSSLFAGLKIQNERANDNKYNRSVPCYLMYHQREVFHYKQFPELEDQMLYFNEINKKDRLDALVWALRFLKSRYTPAYWTYEN